MTTTSGKTKFGKNNPDNLLIYGVLPKLVFDNDTLEILHSNSLLADMLGYSVEELSKLKLSDVIADDFSAQIDNENITFPLGRIKRQFITKYGSIVNYLSESYELDFDCNALVIQFSETQAKADHNTEELVDKVYSSIFLNAKFSNN